jgi:hypothetical protein
MKNVHSPLRAALAAVALLGATAALADEDRFSVHGFGYQDYRQSSDNSYLGADRRGSWDNNFLGIVLAGTVGDRSKVWAQFQANSNEQARVTWMFVDYRFSDETTAYVGRIKFPYGLYNEFIDTKFLQLSAVEPAAYSGAIDMVYDAYNGVGIDHDIAVPGGKLRLQGYLGNIYNPPAPTSSPLCSGNGGSCTSPVYAAEAPVSDRRLYGGRVTWETPVEGLRAMLSFNRTAVELVTAQQPTLGSMAQETRAMLSFDFLRNDWDVKAEFNMHLYPGFGTDYATVRSDAWYVQAGRTLGKLTPYVRYDFADADNQHESDPSYFQRTWVAGLNVRVLDNLNVRGEVHANHGYALPVAAGEVPAGAGKDSWQMFVVSVNFIF